jgi:pyruvate dehydrogenase E1 component alpha subunit
MKVRGRASMPLIMFVRERAVLLEINTYRFRGHSMGDPERYRKPDEVQRWQENDPICIYREYLVNNSLATREELVEQETLAESEVADAVQFAEASPEPAAETLFDHIYVDQI